MELNSKKLVFTGNEIVILDDDDHCYGKTGVFRRLIEKTLLKHVGNIVVLSATTKELWEEVHSAEGRPLIVLHDWDISNLTKEEGFEYTTESSVEHLLSKKYNVILYSGSSKGDLYEFLKKFQIKFIQKGMAAMPELCEFIKELTNCRIVA